MGDRRRASTLGGTARREGEEIVEELAEKGARCILAGAAPGADFKLRAV